MTVKKKNKGELIWQDDSKIKSFIIILVIIWLIPSLFLSVLVFLLYNYILGILAAIASIGCFVYLLNKRNKEKISIHLNGISMGGVKFEGQEGIRSMGQIFFFRWSDILNLKIIGRVVSATYVGYTMPFLILKKKTGGKLYRFGLMNPTSFVQVLKEINKGYLLDKKSRKKYDTNEK